MGSRLASIPPIVPAALGSPSLFQLLLPVLLSGPELHGGSRTREGSVLLTLNTAGKKRAKLSVWLGAEPGCMWRRGRNRLSPRQTREGPKEGCPYDVWPMEHVSWEVVACGVCSCPHLRESGKPCSRWIFRCCVFFPPAVWINQTEFSRILYKAALTVIPEKCL